jgi:hypothetical protein
MAHIDFTHYGYVLRGGQQQRDCVDTEAGDERFSERQRVDRYFAACAVDIERKLLQFPVDDTTVNEQIYSRGNLIS